MFPAAILPSGSEIYRLSCWRLSAFPDFSVTSVFDPGGTTNRCTKLVGPSRAIHAFAQVAGRESPTPGQFSSFSTPVCWKWSEHVQWNVGRFG